MSGNLSDFSFSFVIPTYNAAYHLESCLKSIRLQDYSQARVEIFIVDGGSADGTLELAGKYNCRIIENPKRLAEYGVQLGMREANSDFVVVFAADNELVGKTWLRDVAEVFYKHPQISAVWGKLISGESDSRLNKYFELIQSDPLNWFLNKNLKRYKSYAFFPAQEYFIFYVDPLKPLVWGANGLVYRRQAIQEIWNQKGYLGDNDAFHYMVENGCVSVAYFTKGFVYHHHVARISDWIRKWSRNFKYHLVDKQETRNMRWVFTGNFTLKLIWWVFYSCIPVFSFMHSVYLACKEKNRYWLYHSFVCLAQSITYIYLVFSLKEARKLILKKGLLHLKGKNYENFSYSA